ncbi:MAG: malonyl CoA-ACP transacylase [Deltaproteobacteria bacterium RBG_16_58_17]|nr:MAG: malonyl CoA-ACP transacylase [Deltaproteobacteria bacterium RBG_16_58_17]OHE16305.1 MAG: malonyl CoA-ACP transacylase [Syntrophobacterales bacterium GWC2_56_13]
MVMEGRIDAAVFPGQGSQRTGMGRDFFEQVPESRHTYEEAADILGWDIAAVCFADDWRLHLTQYTQPCIVTTEIAMLRGLFARYGFSPTLFGGHSLGEFTALVAADALPFAAALKIVQERGRLMQEAVQAGAGAMTAVIADELNPEVIANLLDGLLVDVANANSDRQIVLSGETGAVAEAESRIQSALSDLPSLRFVRLNVSAPFHSRFLAPILVPFEKALQELGDDLDPAAAGRVTSNYRGGFHSGGREELIESLVLQISHTVRWKQNMVCLASRADSIWEIGPGRPLREFFRTIGVACTSVTTHEAAERAFAAAA